MTPVPPTTSAPSPTPVPTEPVGEQAVERAAPLAATTEAAPPLSTPAAPAPDVAPELPGSPPSASPPAAAEAQGATAPPQGARTFGGLVASPFVLALLAVVAAAALWVAYTTDQRMKALEVELDKRQQDTSTAAAEARVLARQAETAAREAAAKTALLEARLAETAMQRSLFEDLLQSMARSRDENVLADIEAAVRVAQQQSAITGSVEPMLLVLRQAGERLVRYNQPRLERVRRAIVQDLERVRALGSLDPSLLAARLDEAARQLDDLPMLVLPPQAAPAGARRVAAAVTPGTPGTPGNPGAAGTSSSPSAAASAATRAASASDAAPTANVLFAFLDTLRQSWARLMEHAWAETRSLVRVTRIPDPDAVLVAPEQAWFLRENLKLRLLNARLALMTRQFEVAQSDLRESISALERYFDLNARRTVVVVDVLRQVMAQARVVNLPRPDATLAAIAAASAGR